MVGNLGSDPQGSETEQTRRPVPGRHHGYGGESNPDPLSNESIAKEIGVSRTTLRQAEEHIEAVETFPDLADLPTKTAVREFRKRTGKMKPKESVMIYEERETVAVG